MNCASGHAGIGAGRVFSWIRVVYRPSSFSNSLADKYILYNKEVIQYRSDCQLSIFQSSLEGAGDQNYHRAWRIL
jgi:hypothetical protein